MDDDEERRRRRSLRSIVVGRAPFLASNAQSGAVHDFIPGAKKGGRETRNRRQERKRERGPKPKGRAGGGGGGEGGGGSRFQSLDLDSDRWRCRRGYVQIKGHRTARGLPNDRPPPFASVRRALQETAASLAVRDRSLLRKIAFLPEKPRMPSFFLPPPPRPSICGICCSVCLLGD